MNRGDLVWWKRSGYGYKGQIPAVFKEMSASGKRAYISLTSEDGYRYAMYVDPKRLAPRLPFAAPAAEPPCEHFNTESGFCSKCGECLMRDDESKHGA